MSDDQSQADLRMKLASLKQEHDDLHSAIEAMITLGRDFLQIQRLKRKKLELKDRITELSGKVTPDIIA